MTTPPAAPQFAVWVVQRFLKLQKFYVEKELCVKKLVAKHRVLGLRGFF